jgi:hypothetical protein
VERFTVRSDDVATEAIDDEILVIDFVTNHYYCLNPTAAVVWSMLAASPHSVDELAAGLAGAHDVPVDELHADVGALVTALTDEGLLARQHGDDPSEPAVHELVVTGPWIVPRFEKFGTLDQLMLAGE